MLSLPLKKWSSASLLRLLASACTAFLLAASFPPMENWEAAWIGLVPLVMLSLYSRPGEAWKWGFATGCMCWLGSLAWLLRLYTTGGPLPLVILAWLALAAYCALYIAAFAATLSWLAGRLGVGLRGGEQAPSLVSLRRVAFVILAGLLWAGWEYLRATLFTGFSWNALGVSQFRNRPILQLAEWGGVYAVSAVMVVINAAIALTLVDMLPSSRTPRRRVRPELMVGLALCVALWVLGTRRARTVQYDFAEADMLRVAAVQPNIPQDRKWEAGEESVGRIYEVLRTQTASASLVRPDLVVWPETALPGAVPIDIDSDGFVRALAGRGVPILTGAVEARRSSASSAMNFWNSSFLYGTNGIVSDSYRKVHLVPFGEYVPFDRFVPALAKLAPVGFSCRPGTEQTVFSLGDGPARFSSLICFEDTVLPLARRSVRNGAALLINQTNDAWFDGSSGAVQHMSQCVLRCVENRVSAVRCANTGVTCYIDPSGRIQALAPDEQGRPVTGFAVYGAVLRPESLPLSVHTRYGDWIFGVPCAILAFVIAAAALRDARRERRQNGREPIGQETHD